MFWAILYWMEDLAGVRSRFRALEGVLDERSRRLLAAAESRSWGAGGISAVSQITGMSRPVIRQGLKELWEPAVHPAGRIRRPGGGRKKARQKDPTLVADLEKLVEPTTRGHPETCLRWTCKSVRKLAEELNRLGHQVSYPVVAELLHELDYSLQANRKTKEGDSHPDRDAHNNRPIMRKAGASVSECSILFSFETDFTGRVKAGPRIETWQRRSAAAFTPAVILVISLPESKDNSEPG